MTLADQIQKVRDSADRLGDLVDEWNRKFNKDIMTEPIQQPQPQLLNAYVTLPQGGEEMFNVAPGNFGVDQTGSLFLVFDKNEMGAVTAGKIYAKGHWASVEIEKPDEPWSA